MLSGKKRDGLRVFFSYYLPYKWLLLADLFCSVAAAVLTLTLPICARHITQNILTSGARDAWQSIVQTGVLMILIILAQSGFTIFYDYKGHDMGAKMERDMRNELFAHLQKLPFSFYDNHQTGQIMSRLTTDLLNLSELCHHGPEQLLIYGIQFIGSLAILAVIDWKLTLVVSLFLPFLIVCSYMFYNKAHNAYLVSSQRMAEVNAYVQENLSGIRVVQSFAREEAENTKFNQKNQKFYQSRSDIYKKEMMFGTAVDSFFTPLITVAIIVVGGLWMLEDKLDLSTLLVFVMYVPYLTGPVSKLAFMVQQYQSGLAGYRRFREILDIQPEVKDIGHATDLLISQGQVSFVDVSFRYDEGQDYVLRNINLEVKPGETVAIVGRSGIGKTTLCSLIPRFYKVSEGCICIDGTDIRHVTLKSLRQQIGVVRQDVFLFSGTVMENILYGNPDASVADAVEAANKAYAHEFIMELPKGYDTDIGSQGVKLSGGQQQRLSIARVFLKNPPILILDEATSALDYESERAVVDSLEALAQGRTTFIIAHRQSTIRTADRVIELSGEGITERL